MLIHGIGSRWQIWEEVLGGLAFGASPMATPGTPAGVDSVRLVGAFLAILRLSLAGQYGLNDVRPGV